LWQVGYAPSQRAIARDSKAGSDRAPGYWFTIAQKRVAFSRCAGKFGVRYPCALQELELARNIGIQTDKM
jgi:hypothetical protein